MTPPRVSQALGYGTDVKVGPYIRKRPGERRPLPRPVRKGAPYPYRTIEHTDVYRPTVRAFSRTWFVKDFTGQILPSDVGKRVYLVDEDILQVENDEQFSKRTGWIG